MKVEQADWKDLKRRNQAGRHVSEIQNGRWEDLKTSESNRTSCSEVQQADWKTLKRRNQTGRRVSEVQQALRWEELCQGRDS